MVIDIRVIDHFFCSETGMNLYANAYSMGNKQELETCCRAVVLLGSWRCGGMVCMTGGLQWRGYRLQGKDQTR